MELPKKIFENIKYYLIKVAETNPYIILMILKHIRLFKLLLPHEKDYYGMKLLCTNTRDKGILDIGANLGTSTLGFRQMGFVNKIAIFEPNPEIFKKSLVNIKRSYKNISIFNFALGEKNEKKYFYFPYLNKNKCIHFLCGFDLNHIKKNIRMVFPGKQKSIFFKSKKIDIKNLTI